MANNKQKEEELKKVLFTLALLDKMQEVERRQKEQEIHALLGFLSFIMPQQRLVCDLESVCFQDCKCPPSKPKTRIKWKHTCGSTMYITNQGKILCQNNNCKVNREFPVNRAKLYCFNEIVEEYGYQVNSLSQAQFLCAESIKKVPSQNKEVALQFLREYNSSIQSQYKQK